MSNDLKKNQIEQEIRRIFLAKFPIAANFENVLKYEQNEANGGLFNSDSPTKLFNFEEYKEHLESYKTFQDYINHCLDFGLFNYENSPLTESELIEIKNKITPTPQ